MHSDLQGSDVSGAGRIVALGGGHGLAATLQALRRVSQHITAIVGVADDGGSSGRLRAQFGILPPGDLRMALAAMCSSEPSAQAWADVLQYRFSGSGDLSGHAVGNVLMAALWQQKGDPVAGLDELALLVGAVGRVLPCSVDPLEIVAEIRGHDPQRPNDVCVVRGQVEIATTPGRVLRVWLDPASARVCPQAIDAIRAADAIVLGPGSWFTSLMPHLVLPGLVDAVASAGACKVLVLNLDPQQGETGGFSPAEHIEAIMEQAPSMQFDVVIADSGHVGGDRSVRNLRDACQTWGGELVLADVAGSGDRHDPDKLAAVFDTVLA